MPGLSNNVLIKKRIAVVGGGPKAVALAVKARVLKSLKIQDTEVVIFEKKAIGAAWEGESGYTDGNQLLCTLAERDLGFPYKSLFGTLTDHRMMDFSWQRYKASQTHAYSIWVNAGRKPPKHKVFADYLRWALKRVRNKPVVGEVTKVEVTDSGKRWSVTYVDSSGKTHCYPEVFDGVVMTGPGPANTIPVLNETGTPVKCSRIFNGEDFWKRTGEVETLIKAFNKSEGKVFDTDVLILGGGGTAAATLAWLLSKGCMQSSIQVVASGAVLHTRVDSLFENKIFSDEDIWTTLSKRHQDDFFNRLNRGVVWATVIDKVSAAEGLDLTDGRVTSISMKVETGVEMLSVTVKQGNSKEIVFNPNLLMDATGFNSRWFKALVPQWPTSAEDEKLEDNLGASLEYQSPHWDLPLMHVPTLSKRVGPGFASLMVLGGMSDRILRAYK